MFYWNRERSFWSTHFVPEGAYGLAEHVAGFDGYRLRAEADEFLTKESVRVRGQSWSEILQFLLMSSPSGTEASTTSSSPNSVVATAGAGGNNAPKYGTLVPNRIFVGGISLTTTEEDLTQLFSAYGNVKATKIISDRAGVSKGYGFVTFETEEEARRLHTEADCIVLKERKLNIAPAIKKQAATYPVQPYNRGYESTPAVPTGTVFFHNGYPYTYQNGMAFFAAGANGTPDVTSAAAAAAANGYVTSPYPQPQPPPTYPATTVMFQQPMYIPQQYQYQTMQPSSPAPSQFLFTSAAAGTPLYGTANGGGGSGGGGNGGGGGGLPNMSSSNSSQPTGTYYTTGPPPTSALPPPPPSMPPMTLPPPAQQHHPQPPPAQMAIPEMYITGPTTAIYAQQAAYSMPVPEMFEIPPMTELSSAQSTEDSSSNSSRSGHSNPTDKVNGEGGAKISPSTPVVSLLQLNLQDDGDEDIDCGGSGDGECQEQGDARQHNKAMRMQSQPSHPQHNKRLNMNGVNNSNQRYYHRPQHHRPNHMQQSPTASQPLYYLTPNYMQGPNHFPTPPHPSRFYAPPHHMNGPPPSPHMQNSVGRGQHHGNRPPPPHDQRQFGGRMRPNQRSPRPNLTEGKKYHCGPEGILSCCSPPMQGSAVVCAPMGMPAPGMNIGNNGRQQHRRFQNGPRKQGNRNGEVGDGGCPVQVLPSSGQQRQKLGKCNKSVSCKRQGSATNTGGSTENVSRDGSGDGPCMPITPPGTPSPATARELASTVGPEMVCQMQALSL